MNIVFLTAAEPLYLPAFFADLLAREAADTRAVFTVPPLYGKDSWLAMAGKYTAAFGPLNLCRLGWRTAAARLREALRLGAGAGRYPSVAAAAAAFGVPCEPVAKVNSRSFRQRLRELETDLIVSVSCPQIFRRRLIELPPRGCLNLHGAILPAYRGIAPSFWMMANGERRAGVTVFFVNERIDAGDVVAVEEFDILPGESLDGFIVRSKAIASRVLSEVLAELRAGEPPTRPLDTTGGSYYGFPTRKAYRRFRAHGRRLW